MYKNTEHVLDITDFTGDGSGIARLDGYAIFVPGGIPGDTLKVRIVKELKNYAFGKIIEIIKPSQIRVAPRCEAHGKCGGCSMQAVSYEGQLEFKRKKVQDAIQRIGGFENVCVDTIISGKSACNYRNKAQYPVASDGTELYAGFYAPHSHRVVRADECMLQDKRITEIVNAVTDWANKNGISAYDEQTHRGILRHICVRAGKEEAILTIVTTSHIKYPETLTDMITERFPYVKGIVESINKDVTNVIYGKKERILFGVPYIYDRIGEMKYKVHYKSFYQVNSQTTELLYQKALEFASPDKNTSVFDLYCGTGTISLFLASYAKKVIGIEIVPEAVADAKENAVLNNIDNAEFYCGAAESVAPKLIANGETADIVVLDPPRKGCDDALIRAIGGMKPQKIVYVSCDCATMARDAKKLSEYGYGIAKAVACDQFPYTAHVETVALLSQI